MLNPEVAYTQTDYGPDNEIRQLGDLSVAVNTKYRVLKTVLLRRTEAWRHCEHTRDTG